MPEGDTIYRLAERLESWFGGQIVQSVDERRSPLRASSLVGCRFLNAVNHGKNLLMRFEGEQTLHSHLKMSGAWTTGRPGMNPNVPKLGLRFSSNFLWGVGLPILELYPTPRESHRLARLGPDLIRTARQDQALLSRLQLYPDLPLSGALLRQSIAAGLGNIYAVEVPFLLGLSPFVPVSRLGDAAATVWQLGQALLRANACLGPQTTTGFKQKSLLHYVYGKGGRACSACSTKLRSQREAETSWGRSIWWCPECQPVTRTLPEPERALRLIRRHRLAVALYHGDEQRLEIARSLSPQARIALLC